MRLEPTKGHAEYRREMLPEETRQKIDDFVLGKEVELSELERGDAIAYIDDEMADCARDMPVLDEKDKAKMMEVMNILQEARNRLEQQALLKHLKKQSLE